MPELSALADPLHVIALTLWGEARGEQVEGRVAVGCVIRNRTLDPRWPNTFPQVCLQPKQFSCWNEADANRAKLMDLAAVFVADHAIRTATRLDPVLRECLFLAEGLLAGVLLDRSGAANHYLTTQLLERQPPSWVLGHSPVAVVGRHSFFRL